jgi:hypothetical protein
MANKKPGALEMKACGRYIVLKPDSIQETTNSGIIVQTDDLD